MLYIMVTGHGLKTSAFAIYPEKPQGKGERASDKKSLKHSQTIINDRLVKEILAKAKAEQYR